MKHSWVGLLAICAILGWSLCGCVGAAETAGLAPPAAKAEATEPPSLLETVQEVAAGMVESGPVDMPEATPTNAQPIPEVDLTRPMVALTFDDGPMEGSTAHILDILEANGARATFFVQGKQAAKHPELVRRAYGLGCQIGNHTYNHKDLTSLNNRDALGQLASVNSLVQELTGEGCALVRPPHGKGWRDSRILNLVPYPLILWSIDTNDWSTRDPKTTIAAVLEDVKDGDIVLMHDIYEETAEAAAAIVPELLARGYQLVTVSEMFAYKGLELSPGNAYRQAG